MKTFRLRRYLVWVSVLSSAALPVAACSSDTDRPTFDGDPDGAVAHLPESGSPIDDASPADVLEARAPFDPAAEAVVCAASGPCAVDIVAGQSHFCALMSDKTVRCWGDDSVGELGDQAPPVDAGKDAGHDAGDAGDAGFAVGHVPALADVVQLSAAAMNTCALLASGNVDCWGADDSAQLGLTVDPPTNDYDPHPLPARVALGSTAARVDVGQRSSCAVLVNSEVWCWGDNEEGQLGLSADTTYGGPAKSPILNGTSKIVQTAAGTNTAFSIDDQGRIASWGAVADIEGSASGRVASSSPDLLPSLLVIPAPVTSFSISSWFDYTPPFDGVNYPPDRGIAHACAVVKGTLYCWGDSVVGAVGVGLVGPVAAPAAVVIKGNAYPQQVAAAHENTCARLTDGTVQCVGDDTFGQLGRAEDGGPFDEFFSPASAFTGHAVKVAASDAAVCALESGGQVVCWGGNSNGELGQGTTDSDAHRTPVPVRF